MQRLSERATKRARQALLTEIPAVATQKDIAKIAGVSQSVVSRVFANNQNVSQASRSAVLAAGAKVGYFPDAGARALVTGSSNIVGIVVANIMNSFYPYSFDLLTSSLQKTGRDIMLFNASGGRDIDSLFSIILTYKIRAVVILTAEATSSLALRLRERGIQVVMLNRFSADLGSSTVACDNIGGGKMVAEAFLESGYKRVAYIGGNPTASTNIERRQGFIDTMAAAGYQPILAIDGEFAHAWGYEAGYILERINDIEAVFCADDDIAMGIIDHLRFEAQWSIPGRIALVGYDDVPGASWPAYGLSTVQQPIDDMIRITLELLEQAASNPPHHYRPTGVLIRRHTF